MDTRIRSDRLVPYPSVPASRVIVTLEQTAASHKQTQAPVVVLKGFQVVSERWHSQDWLKRNQNEYDKNPYDLLKHDCQPGLQTSGRLEKINFGQYWIRESVQAHKSSSKHAEMEPSP